MRHRLVWCTLSFTALLAGACADSAVQQARSADGISLPAVSDTLRPDLVVGREDGRTEEAFGRIRDIEVGPNGRIYVLDGQASAVQVFDAEGSFVRSVGREGDGPGEFRRPLQLAVGAEGSIWVYDSALEDVLWLDSLGTEIARYPSTSSGITGGRLSSIWDGFLDAQGRLVQTIQTAAFEGGTGIFSATNPSYVRRLDPTSGSVDSTLVAEDTVRRYRYQGEGPGGRPATFTGIYSLDPRRLIAVGPEGEIWTAHSTEYVVTRVAPSGDSTVIRVATIESEPTDSELEFWSRINEVVPSLEPPTQRHVLARLFVDSDGSLWLQRADGNTATGRIDIFEADGSFRRSVIVPETFALNVRDGHVYAVEFDDLRIGRVVRIPVPTVSPTDR